MPRPRLIVALAAGLALGSVAGHLMLAALDHLPTAAGKPARVTSCDHEPAGSDKASVFVAVVRSYMVDASAGVIADNRPGRRPVRGTLLPLAQPRPDAFGGVARVTVVEASCG